MRGGAARAAGDLVRAVGRDMEVEQPRGAADHRLELVDRVEGEPHRDTEPVAQRGGEQPLARGCAHQREARQVDAHRARARTLADHQIERAILHRRIEDLLDRGREPVDLVDEQHVAVLEVGEQRGEIARLGDHRARSGAEPHPHLARDDLRERGLAQPGRAEEQHMVERLAAPPGGGDEHAQVLARRLLADEFVERLGPQRGVDVVRPAGGGEDAVGVAHAPLLAAGGGAGELRGASAPDRQGRRAAAPTGGEPCAEPHSPRLC